MNYYEFCQWWWGRFFEHLNAVESTAMQNMVNILVAKVNEQEKRMIAQGL